MEENTLNVMEGTSPIDCKVWTNVTMSANLGFRQWQCMPPGGRPQTLDSEAQGQSAESASEIPGLSPWLHSLVLLYLKSCPSRSGV